MIFFFIAGPFSITQWNKINILIIFILSSTTLLLTALLGRKLRFWLISFYPSLIYIFSFIVSLFALILTREYLTGEYFDSVIFGRLFTFITVSFVLFIINLWLSQVGNDELLRSLKITFSIGFCFVLLGHWQFIGNLFGIPFFIETRDWMHGVPAAIRSVLPMRLTSIAEEPNFLSPLLIEYLILTGLVVNGVLIRFGAYALGLFVLVLSFSGGVYVNLILILAFYSILSLYRSFTLSKIKIRDFIFLFFIVLCFGLVISIGNILIDFISVKLQGEAGGQSGRSQFLLSLTQLISNSDFSQLLLGHGMATMSVLTAFGLPKDEFLFRITNNFYLDMIWEGGFLGLFLILMFFIYLLFIGIKSYLINKYYEAGLLFTVHMMITCLYRSEYLSSHFLWVMTLIFICYKKGAIDMQRELTSSMPKINNHSATLRGEDGIS
ncbi:Lipid A core - O-antigen ligase and related enzymes [Shewanella morhuae]|uniref:Lipid A core - O-antigen ligase and related enzymes n=2 Tax=Shewanella morhuae TaxID=365591 RepID=A0A380A8B6_9GAMM|nr:Lipid A core - O-antigen ligase and related enzymes [Shewanella morhuae]